MMTRREKIAAMLRENKLDAVMLTGGDNLVYATGMPGIEGIAVITADGEGWLFTDSRYIEDAEARVGAQGYCVIMPEGSYPTPDCVEQIVRAKGVRMLGFEDRAVTFAEYQQYLGALSCALRPVGDAFELLREVKEQAEVDCIVKAQRIAEAALDELYGLIRPGVTELEMAGELEYRMRRHGSEGPAFSTIFVSGPKSAMPHGTPGERKVCRGDFIVIDFGASFGGYRSDMTRTVAVGEATDEMRTVYQTVLEAQKRGIEAFVEGALGSDVHNAAAEVIEKAGYGKYFGHGLGHSLGLLIHENPRASRTSQSRFKQGNIITIEPGIYLPGKFGVRIEDMMYLSASGPVNLTKMPKELLIL